MDWNIGLVNSEHVLQNTKVIDFLKDPKQKFDVVVVDKNGYESLYALAHKFGCPLVTIGELVPMIYDK